MKSLKIAIFYSLFALIATVVNLLAQGLSLYLYNQAYDLVIAILFGTLVGLVCKYILDKHFIFNHIDNSLDESISTFGLYSITGVFTTLLFWAFEFGFDAYFETRQARIIGAIIGLSLGYVIKYRLDKHFVFTRKAEQ